MTKEQQITVETSVVSVALLKLINKIPVSTFAKFVGVLSTAATVGATWIQAIENENDRQKMGVALASRMLDSADVLIAVSNGKKLEDVIHVRQPDSSASAIPNQPQTDRKVEE